MKKTLLSSLLFIHFLSVYSQAFIYHPMPENNAMWRVDHNSTPCGSPYVKESFQYTMGADTIVGVYSYKKIYASGMFLCGSPAYFSNNYIGGLRNDSINKKVYFLFPGYADTLLYDFNLIVGDTMFTLGGSLTYTPTSYSYVITSIDSVLVGSNYHKRFNSLQSFPFSIIEGVGGNCGLIEPLMSYIDDVFFLQCFTHDSDIYPSSASTCPLVTNTVGIEKLNHGINKIVITPNPFHNEGILELHDKADEINAVDIFNSYGKIIKEARNLSNDKYIINATGLTPGLYIICVFTKNAKQLTTKFIID